MPTSHRIRSGGAIPAYGEILAGVALFLYLPRSLARTGVQIRPGPEASYLRAHGRDSCRSDHEPARSYRWQPELGLSVYMASRCRVHCVCLSANRVSGGSCRFYALDRRPRYAGAARWKADSGDVYRRGIESDSRNHLGALGGISRIRTGANWQWRCYAISNRYLR